MIYVSITGLRLKGPLHAFRFWWHGSRSMAQALRAPGNLQAGMQTIKGIHHTLSVWTDEAAMRRYLVSGAHRHAMAAFRSMATGRTMGFYADKAPDWSEVHELWLSDGKDV